MQSPMHAIDLTKITSEERRQQVDEMLNALQARLKRELQVLVYSTNSHEEDSFDEIVQALQLSAISFPTGNDGSEKYAVKVFAEKLGEIPYALSCIGIYTPTPGDNQSASSDHTMAMAALTTALTKTLSFDQLSKFLSAARDQGKITDEQFQLATNHFVGEE